MEAEAAGVGPSGGKRRKKKAEKRIDISVVDAKEEGKVGTAEEAETVKNSETIEKGGTSEKVDAVEAAELVESGGANADKESVNVVLQKLLRGPRYFDPPDSGWSTCYNCGEEGHMAVNCPTPLKKIKPCFVCGSLEHGAKQCSKGRDCFICKKSGHRAKNCPDKYNITPQSSKICLKCGGSGHEMFSCLLMISRKYNATSARVLAIYVVLPLVLIVWDKFLATDVVNWVILVWSQLVVSSSHKPSLAVRIEASKARRSTDLKFFRPARNGSLSHQLSTGIKNFTRMFLVKNQATIMWSYDINLISWLDSALQGKSSALILTEQY